MTQCTLHIAATKTKDVGTKCFPHTRTTFSQSLLVTHSQHVKCGPQWFDIHWSQTENQWNLLMLFAFSTTAAARHTSGLRQVHMSGLQHVHLSAEYTACCFRTLIIIHKAVGDFTFYRAMHYSAKRGIAIACRLSVRLSVCEVGGSGSHRSEILETNCTDT